LNERYDTMQVEDQKKGFVIILTVPGNEKKGNAEIRKLKGRKSRSTFECAIGLTSKGPGGEG